MASPAPGRSYPPKVSAEAEFFVEPGSDQIPWKGMSAAGVNDLVCAQSGRWTWLLSLLMPQAAWPTRAMAPTGQTDCPQPGTAVRLVDVVSDQWPLWQSNRTLCRSTSPSLTARSRSVGGAHASFVHPVLAREKLRRGPRQRENDLAADACGTACADGECVAARRVPRRDP